MNDVRAGIKLAARWCIEQLSSPSARPDRRVVVLCYHSIHPSKSFASASPTLFEEHIVWLRENTEIIGFDQTKTATVCHDRVRPAVAITFDDGYADNHEYALPILERHAVSAHFFLTVGLLERDPSVLEWFRTQRAALMEDIQPLAWTAVAEMRQTGMRIGCHTWSHPNLARIGARAAGAELVRSKQLLEERLDQAVNSLAYPYGKPKRHVTPQVIAIATQSGYRHAASATFRGVRPTDDPLCIPRFFVTGDSVETLASKVLGRLDAIGRLQECSPSWLGRILSPKEAPR